MQLFQQPFNAQNVKPSEAFEALPVGWYHMRIITSEAKPTKDNESGYLQLELEVIDGEAKGRKVFDRLNLWNKSVQASEIAQRQLSAYCHATGVMVLTDSNQLHGIPIKVRLSIRTQDGFEPSNEVKAVKHIEDTVPGATQAFGGGAPTNPPFGMSPSLPAMPTTPVPTVAPQPTTQAPPPWGPPAAPQPQAPFTPPAAPAAPMAPVASTAPPQSTWTPPTGTATPVPPWRK